MEMFDPFMTSLSVGWILLGAGVISMLVIATERSSNMTDLRFQPTKCGSRAQNLKPAARWSLIAISFVLCSYGVFRIQQDRNWSPLQEPYSVHTTSLVRSAEDED
jgi:hypothetical protein